MKKKTLLIAVIILLIIAAIFIGWFKGRSGRTSEENADISQEITAKTPGEQVLDTRYPTDSKLGKMIDNRVSSVIGEETSEKITVRVTAPLIQEDLLLWYEAVSEEDYSDEALESEIEQLLTEKTPVEREYVFEIKEGTVIFTEEYLNHISCGIEDFYKAVLAEVLSNMTAIEEAE